MPVSLPNAVSLWHNSDKWQCASMLLDGLQCLLVDEVACRRVTGTTLQDAIKTFFQRTQGDDFSEVRRQICGALQDEHAMEMIEWCFTHRRADPVALDALNDWHACLSRGQMQSLLCALHKRGLFLDISPTWSGATSNVLSRAVSSRVSHAQYFASLCEFFLNAPWRDLNDDEGETVFYESRPWLAQEFGTVAAARGLYDDRPSDILVRLIEAWTFGHLPAAFAGSRASLYRTASEHGIFSSSALASNAQIAPTELVRVLNQLVGSSSDPFVVDVLLHMFRAHLRASPSQLTMHHWDSLQTLSLDLAWVLHFLEVMSNPDMPSMVEHVFESAANPLSRDARVRLGGFLREIRRAMGMDEDEPFGSPVDVCHQKLSMKIVRVPLPARKMCLPATFEWVAVTRTICLLLMGKAHTSHHNGEMMIDFPCGLKSITHAVPHQTAVSRRLSSLSGARDVRPSFHDGDNEMRVRRRCVPLCSTFYALPIHDLRVQLQRDPETRTVPRTHFIARAIREKGGRRPSHDIRQLWQERGRAR